MLNEKGVCQDIAVTRFARDRQLRRFSCILSLDFFFFSEIPPAIVRPDGLPRVFEKRTHQLNFLCGDTRVQSPPGAIFAVLLTAPVSRFPFLFSVSFLCFVFLLCSVFLRLVLLVFLVLLQLSFSSHGGVCREQTEGRRTQGRLTAERLLERTRVSLR